MCRGMASKGYEQFRKITLLLYAIAVTSIVLCSSGTNAGESIWDHNGSKIRWVSDGNSRQAYYLEPRPDLARLGIHPGQLLFEGYRRGNVIEGRAFTFKPGCPPLGFPVSGKLLSETTFDLKGTAPRRDSGCDTTSSVNKVLRFIYEGTTVEGPKLVPSGPAPGPGGTPEACKKFPLLCD
jgi:hypothetical protein